MFNFEKQLLDKLPQYYEEGLIDNFSEQRLRNYLLAKTSTSGSKFNLSILYIVAFVLAVLGAILFIDAKWKNFECTTKLVIAFIPIIFSASLSIYYFLRRYDGNKTYFCDFLAILNVLSVLAAISVTSITFDINENPKLGWAIIILTSLPTVLIFRSLAAAVLLIIFSISNFVYVNDFGKLENVMYLTTIALAYYIYKTFTDNTDKINYLAYILLGAIMPLFILPFEMTGEQVFLSSLPLAIAFPLLKYANSKNDYVGSAAPILFSWGFLTILLVFAKDIVLYRNGIDFSIRAFFESLKNPESLNFLSLGTAYIVIFYFFYKFIKSILNKEANKAYVVLSSIGILPILILNDGVSEESLKSIFTIYAFVSAFAFLISAIKRKSFAQLNCGSLLVVIWALLKCTEANNFISASKTLVITAICIAIINLVFSKILALRGE